MYVSSKYAQQYFNVSGETLRKWELSGKIQVQFTNGHHRRYKLPSESEQRPNERFRFIYARVSSRKQKNELEHQIQFLKEKYPHHKVLYDFGSGLNIKRKKFLRILEHVLSGNVDEIVVAYKDRLSRFHFDLIELICRKFQTKITVLNEDENKEPAEEFSEDLISIITYFTAKYYGSRKYKLLQED